MTLMWLDPSDIGFPQTQEALDEPNGLLAAGGALTPEWLLCAYQRGIFPWYNEGDPVLWWSPAPRMVIFPKDLHISRSLRKAMIKLDYTVTINHDFNGVISACSEPRPAKNPDEQEDGTWISPEMLQAYNRLHRLGFAHSVEVWHQGTLAGGLYGVAIDRVFFGESMFSRISNGSKIAISYLAHYLQSLNYQLIDCQLHNPHLESLGGIEIERERFESLLADYAQLPNPPDYPANWQGKTLLNPFI